MLLIQKVKDPYVRLWYVCQTIEQGWSRAILQAQIESKLYERQGKALTNFKRTLPSLESDLAQQTLKDPYNFDFLTLRHEAQERELEQGLLENIKDFLLELGTGFAFVGSQVPLEVEGQTFFLDVLFYHTRLRRYVVIELKARQFEPEFAGKLNFYLSAVDDLIKGPEDKATIGLILCKIHKRYIVEYALRDMRKPIGVAEWKTRLLQSLPEELRGSMPTIEEIEAELQDRLNME